MTPAAMRVLLTGAGGGIGRAAALALLDAGASLLLVGRSPARLVAQAQALQQRAGLAGEAGNVARQRVDWAVADLAGPAASFGPLVEAAQRFGVNVLVHNAGLPAFGRLQALDAATVQQVLHTNLLGPVLLTQALLPQLLAQPQARVLCVGSALGRMGLPGYSVYSASKFGLRGFAEALRRELRGSPVQVQYLGPRSTRTAFNEPAAEAQRQATHGAQDEPAAVAAALLQLLQGSAAEAFIGWPERLAGRLNGLAPALFDAVLDGQRRALPATAAASPAAAALNP